MGRLGFANLSTCALEFAGLREWLVGQRRGHPVLPIRALARSNLQDRGWWMRRGTWFCQFEHLRAQICRTEGSGLLDKGGDTRFCQFEHLRARICRTGGSRWVERLGGWTERLEFAELGVEVGGEARFCQFEHLRTQICRTKSGAGGLGFAESSTEVLESASPGWWQGWGSSIQGWWVEKGSSLQIRARKCSNLQTWGGG